MRVLVRRFFGEWSSNGQRALFSARAHILLEAMPILLCTPTLPLTLYVRYDCDPQRGGGQTMRRQDAQQRQLPRIGSDQIANRHYGILKPDIRADQEEVRVAKILAAGRPLSVQVHPNARDAKRMWDGQQIAGPAVLADAYEKAEVLVALEPFDAFVGWRPASDAAEMLERVDGMALAAAALHADDRVAAIQLIHEQQSHAPALVGQLPEAIDRANDAGSMTRVMSESEIAAYRNAAADFPADIGVLMTPLLNFVTLLPGDAVYLRHR